MRAKRFASDEDFEGAKEITIKLDADLVYRFAKRGYSFNMIYGVLKSIRRQDFWEIVKRPDLQEAMERGQAAVGAFLNEITFRALAQPNPNANLIIYARKQFLGERDVKDIRLDKALTDYSDLELAHIKQLLTDGIQTERANGHDDDYEHIQRYGRWEHVPKAKASH